MLDRIFLIDFDLFALICQLILLQVMTFFGVVGVEFKEPVALRVWGK